MKKTFLVLIAALVAASSIQATEAQQPRSKTQYIVSQDRIDFMAAQLEAVTAREISKSAPKAVQKNTGTRDSRSIASAQATAPVRKAVETSS